MYYNFSKYIHNICTCILQILAYGSNQGVDYSYSVPTYFQEYSKKDEETVPVVYIDGGSI